MGIEVFKKHLREKRVVIVKAGADNYNHENIEKICKAAQFAHASAVSIACDKEIYNLAQKNTKLPIIISSFHPYETLKAVQWGIEIVEIGGYDKKFNENEIYDIALETLSLISKYDVYTIVTIPSDIETEKQIKLIEKLQVLGIDLINVEANKTDKSLTSTSQAVIENAYKLYQKISLPIMTSLNINSKDMLKAFEIGSIALGVNLSNYKINSEASLNTMIASVVSSISYRNSINKEIIKTKRELLS